MDAVLPSRCVSLHHDIHMMGPDTYKHVTLEKYYSSRSLHLKAKECLPIEEPRLPLLRLSSSGS